MQADLTVLLEQASPRADEARDQLIAFAELVKAPEHVHTYRLTPLSIVRLAFESALILRCPDPGGAGGAKLELVGDRILILSDPKERAKIQRACSKQGVFIDSESTPEKKPARKKRRRQRYW